MRKKLVVKYIPLYVDKIEEKPKVKKLDGFEVFVKRTKLSKIKTKN